MEKRKTADGNATSYMEQLRRDSQELHSRRALTPNQQFRGESRPAIAQPPSDESVDSSPNDLFPETIFSTTKANSVLPIHIGETACTVFAARVCQCLNGSDAHGSDTSTHPLQWNYVDEAEIAMLVKKNTPWPSLAQARLLVQTALTHVNPVFHLALRKNTMDLLNEVYKKKRFSNAAIKGKFFALFALGQLYSAFPDSANTRVPGSAYFAQALSLMHIPPERPSIMHLEATLSVVCGLKFLLPSFRLVFFGSLTGNRRYFSSTSIDSTPRTS